jgi:hypothetical protein
MTRRLNTEGTARRFTSILESESRMERKIALAAVSVGVLGSVFTVPLAQPAQLSGWSNRALHIAHSPRTAAEDGAGRQPITTAAA